jgi:hypothetical protein
MFEFLWNLFIHSEDGGNKLHRKVTTHLPNYAEVKVTKCKVPVHTMKAYRGRRGIVALILNLGIIYRGVNYMQSQPKRQHSSF